MHAANEPAESAFLVLIQGKAGEVLARKRAAGNKDNREEVVPSSDTVYQSQECLYRRVDRLCKVCDRFD